MITNYGQGAEVCTDKGKFKRFVGYYLLGREGRCRPIIKSLTIQFQLRCIGRQLTVVHMIARGTAAPANQAAI